MNALALRKSNRRAQIRPDTLFVGRNPERFRKAGENGSARKTPERACKPGPDIVRKRQNLAKDRMAGHLALCVGPTLPHTSTRNTTP